MQFLVYLYGHQKEVFIYVIYLFFGQVLKLQMGFWNGSHNLSLKFFSMNMYQFYVDVNSASHDYHLRD